MKRFLFVVIIVLVIIWAWNEKSINPEYIINIDTVYIVKTNNVKIRKGASINTKILGKINKNDTVKGVLSNDWLNINGIDSCGFIFKDNLDLKVIKSKTSIYAGNETQLKIKNFITNYISLKKWYIWVTILISLIIAITANVLLHKLEIQIFKWKYKFYHERINWFPYFAGFLSILLGIVSVFFQHKSIIAVSDFTLLPIEKGWVAWFWSVIIGLMSLSFIYSSINGFFHYGIGLGLLRLLGELITAIITVLALYLFAIVLSFIAILGIILYLIFIGFNSTSNFNMPNLSDMLASWQKYDEQQRDFMNKQNQFERYQDEIRKKYNS